MAQMRGRGGVARSDGAKNNRNVQNAADKIVAPRGGVMAGGERRRSHMAKHGSKLCTTVSGCSFREYLGQRPQLPWTKASRQHFDRLGVWAYVQSPVSGMRAMSQVALTMGSRRTWPSQES